MPYMDYGGFGQDYFEGESVTTPHEAGYDDYRRGLLPFDAYGEKMASIMQNYNVDPSQANVLVVGCAYGYTVEWLRNNYGTEAWGMDISTYAVNNDVTTDQVVRQGDVLNSTDLRNVRQESPSGKFDVVFSECLLSCLTDSEAQTAAQNCRDEAQQTAVHRVWTSGRVNSTYYNAKTLSEWQSLVDPDGNDQWYTDTSFQPYSN